MPVGLRFQRKHRRLGYRLKYLYYLAARRDVLQKRVSYGNDNAGQTVYVVKPDYQDGVEGLLSLVFKQVLYIDWAKKQGYIPYVDWKHFKTQYHDGIHNAWEYFFRQPSALTEEQVAQVETHMDSLMPAPLPAIVIEESEPPVESEICRPTVNYTYVAPFGEPVTGGN